MEFILSFIGLVSCLCLTAQNQIFGEQNDKIQYTCDSLIHNLSFVQLRGQVNFETDLLKIKNADLIIFDTVSREIEAMGCEEISFSGTVHFDRSRMPLNKIRYRLGDQTIYLE